MLGLQSYPKALEQAPIFALHPLPIPHFSPHSYRVEDQHELEDNINKQKYASWKNLFDQDAFVLYAGFLTTSSPQL